MPHPTSSNDELAIDTAAITATRQRRDSLHRMDCEMGNGLLPGRIETPST
ncbi:MAG: hypothetical protein WCE63_19320 [Acidobacteriaceae bacterium]